ncbi:SLAC1 anion channel family protein [Caminibacter pacificus]|uniref:C4-dicarboxylate ABC transporter n=1 Tax=Caminibacter pacificus TaxID=1424653 RepID=A0AAJ4UX74_9BACT|nr:SLAC1 anion channel family protein [Caminibacter pacificus]NPA87464.1 C4-dicarboxylate ABC transporter [Campylobacterota bacterium]QCI27535.1 C4-dicarboxylate ABC transporter [Caminibacter pacificus]ROR38974.1 tellurite resistance protein [Caminibacter pacificus]
MQRNLAYFPIQLFAVIMGLSGITIATAKAWHFLNLPIHWLYLLLLVIDTIAFFVILTLYLIKLIKYPDMVKKEFNHPIKSSFFAAISISFLLVSIAYMDFAPTITVVFWYIGAILQIIFTFIVIKFWIINDFEVHHINPAWFIPIVGNVLVPVAGVDVAPLFVNLFFFSIGMFFWIVLFTIVVYRMIFHHPLGKRLIPTFFILIAPPAVGFISYFRITFGLVDMFSLFLYSIALFILILLFSMYKMFIKLQFFISWWAYTFPLAAITIATILLDTAYHNVILKSFSILLWILTFSVVCFVAYKTFVAIKNQKICVPEEE